jgi:N-acetylglucosamine transport system permease protein
MSTLVETPAAPVAPPVAASPQRKDRKPFGPRAARAFAQAFLVFWAITVTLPLVWIVVSAFKSSGEILADPWSLPATPMWENFSNAWSAANFGTFFFNTTVVTLGGLAITIALSSMVAFTVAKFEFPGKSLIVSLFVGVMTFPTVLSLMPLFFLMLGMGLVDNNLGLTLVYGAYGMAFSTFFLIGFFQTLPSELMEAARVDGCGWWGTFFRIMLPLARPGIVGVAIFQFMSMWNQYILPLVLQATESKYVLGLGIVRLAIEQGFRGDWGALFAGMVISIIPVVVLYLAFHRQVQVGLTAGAVKF